MSILPIGTLARIAVFHLCGSKSKWPDQVIPRERQRETVMRAKKFKIKEEDLVRRYQDLLEIVRLVSWCMNRDHLIKTCLDHIGQRLGKRARYLLMEGDELKLHCWVGRYECDVVKKGCASRQRIGLLWNGRNAISGEDLKSRLPRPFTGSHW
jgi:hypothetical protein